MKKTAISVLTVLFLLILTAAAMAIPPEEEEREVAIRRLGVGEYLVIVIVPPISGNLYYAIRVERMADFYELRLGIVGDTCPLEERYCPLSLLEIGMAIYKTADEAVEDVNGTIGVVEEILKNIPPPQKKDERV